MRPFTPQTVPRQLAAHLKEEIVTGRLEGTMPGALRLARTLGVHQSTVGKALAVLEREGLLVSRGPGQRRIIQGPDRPRRDVTSRIGILLHHSSDRDLPYILKLQHHLHEAGHATALAGRTLTDIDMEPERLRPLIRATGADAWIVVAGSQDILIWFMTRSIPAFALFGHMLQQPIAGGGPQKAPAYLTATRNLLDLGHRRIVYLTESRDAYHRPGQVVRSFLEELTSAGISTGIYNAPEWDLSPLGLQQCLDRLFAKTPPTALLIDGPALFTATQQHLSRRGIHAPEQVSLVCSDPDPVFDWQEPTVAHIHWKIDSILRRAVRWANHAAQGITDLRKTLTKASFIDGGTVGPVPK